MIHIDCHKCQFYYVTWDKRFPHGCRAMRFKSHQIPSAMVSASSNRECLMFRPKKNSNPPTPKKPKGGIFV